MEFDELLTSPAFWLLGGGGILMEVLGYQLSKSWGTATFPIWQLLILMGGTLVAAAFFAMQE